jgi:hypothetical protein
MGEILGFEKPDNNNEININSDQYKEEIIKTLDSIHNKFAEKKFSDIVSQEDLISVLDENVKIKTIKKFNLDAKRKKIR